MDLNKGKFMVSVKINNNEYQYFSIPYEVYIYIRQLEEYIRDPKASKLKEAYIGRFEENT